MGRGSSSQISLGFFITLILFIFILLFLSFEASTIVKDQLVTVKQEISFDRFMILSRWFFEKVGRGKNVVSEQKLLELESKSYEEIKEELKIGWDFFIRLGAHQIGKSCKGIVFERTVIFKGKKEALEIGICGV